MMCCCSLPFGHNHVYSFANTCRKVSFRNIYIYIYIRKLDTFYGIKTFVIFISEKLTLTTYFVVQGKALTLDVVNIEYIQVDLEGLLTIMCAHITYV